MTKKPIIPFGFWPAHWGLAGKTRDRARAEYELSGRDLEIRLSEIDLAGTAHADIKHREAVATIDFKYGLIDQEGLDRRLVDVHNHDNENKRKIAHMELDMKYGKVTDTKKHAKELATLRGEPWLDVIKLDFDPKDPVHSGGSFHLDWNDQFVEKLKQEGYSGANGEMIVAQWFDALCRVVARENDIPFDPDAPKIKRDQGGNGKVNYS